MPNVVVVVKDERVSRQIEQFIGELDLEGMRVATFKRVEEFEGLYFRALAKQEPKPEEAESPAANTAVAFDELHLVIFATDAVGVKTGPWIDKVRQNLIRYGRKPAEKEIRFIMLKYEDDGISKLDILHPHLDDLIYLPLDRLIFLQKLEIILALPKVASPSFLFNQEVRQDIEISKIAKLDRLSDVAMAIRNPVALQPGLPGKFYVQLPGDKNRMELLGKVMRSDPHPDYPGQFLVYFGYFGISKSSLSQIRRTLSKAPRYQSLKSEDREAVRWRPDDLFATADQRHEFVIALIDPDEQNSNAMAQQLVKEMDRLVVMTEGSYSVFLYKYFQMGGADAKAPPPGVSEEKDFFSPVISLSVSTADLGCLSVNPGPSDTDLFLGHPAKELFSAPDKWHKLLQDKESRLVLDEAVTLANLGRPTAKLAIFTDSEGNRRAVNLKLGKSDTDKVVLIEIAPANLGDILGKMTSESTSKALDVMLVDSSFVPEDTTTWIQGLRTRALQLNLVPRAEDLKFLLLSHTDAAPKERIIHDPNILGLFIKPVETRQLLFFLSECLQNKNTLFTFENLSWSSPAAPIHVSKGVHLEALSEFGATLRSSSKLAPGTMVYLRKSIYDNAPNSCLAARVYNCQEHPSEKGFFQVHTTYFGINEAFLKYARTWIRENYAQQKSQSGGE